MSLIRRAGRKVWLTIDKKEYPYPQLVFYDEDTKEVAIVNVKGQQIASLHAKNKKKFEQWLQKKNVKTQLDRAREIQKWINFMRI